MESRIKHHLEENSEIQTFRNCRHFDVVLGQQHILGKQVQVSHPEHLGLMTEYIYLKPTRGAARIMSKSQLQLAGTNNVSEILLFMLT